MRSGFPLGGYTVLASAGARADNSRVAAHCATAHNDPEFCIGGEGGKNLPLRLRLWRAFYSIPDVNTDQDVLDPRIIAIVAAAPVGLPFSDLARVTLPVMLIRAGADQVLRYPYHAENVHNLLQTSHRYEVVDGLHHYAFLTPFPRSIASEVGEPALDPDGFDRTAFLAEINAEIVEFFREHLVSR